MGGSTFVIRDADIRPRSGQNVILHHHSQQLRGVVDSLAGNCVRIRPESFLLLRQLRAGTRLAAQILTGEGTLDATLSLLSVGEDIAVFQIVGLPRLLQRRGHPRVGVRLPATMTWLVPLLGTMHQAQGTTQNLSMGGALVRFVTAPQHLPKEHAATLLAIELPKAAVSLPVRAVQVWENGTRVRFADVDPEAADQLRAFIEPQLS